MKPSEFIKNEVERRKLDFTYEIGLMEDLDAKFISRKEVIEIIDEWATEHKEWMEVQTINGLYRTNAVEELKSKLVREARVVTP